MYISAILGGLFAVLAAVVQAWATLRAATRECDHKTDSDNERD